MKVQNRLFLLISSVFVFFYSMYFSALASGGDQVIYSNFYEKLGRGSLAEGYLVYAATLSKTELLYFFVAYLGSYFEFNKVIYMSFFNCLLFLAASVSLNRIGIPLIYCTLIVWSNYYTQMLFFSGERLKFGMLLFFLCFVFQRENNKVRPSLVLLSIFGHLQMIILWFSISVEIILQKLARIYSNLKISKVLLIVICFSLIISTVLIPSILKKIYFYADYYNGLGYGFLKWFIFYFITLLSSKKRLSVSSFYLALLIPFLIVGSERLVIFCNVFFFMQYGNRSRYFILTSLFLCFYFFVKSIGFILNIYMYGDGFY